MPLPAEAVARRVPPRTEFDLPGAVEMRPDAPGEDTMRHPAVAADACLATNVPSTSLEDAATPDLGDGFFYLARGRNCAGVATWDDGSPTQLPGRDAEISVCP